MLKDSKLTNYIAKWIKLLPQPVKNILAWFVLIGNPLAKGLAGLAGIYSFCLFASISPFTSAVVAITIAFCAFTAVMALSGMQFYRLVHDLPEPRPPAQQPSLALRILTRLFSFGNGLEGGSIWYPLTYLNSFYTILFFALKNSIV